ncbi:MAG: YfhO family protein [Saprospiraceae bacterium]|nr:YfhO family protein [Saprospiraceae bacterium]
MKNIDLKQITPHLITIVALWMVSVLYFLPVMQGKTIIQSDIQSWEGMAQEAIQYNENHSDPALWSNSMFGGMPLYQTILTPKGNLLRYLQAIPLALGKSPLNVFFGIMLFSYLGLLLFGIQNYIAGLGAVVIALSTGNMLLVEAGHMTKLMVISYAALTMSGLWWSYKGNLWWGIPVFAFGFGMQIMNNHVQMSYYLMIGLIPMAILHLIQTFKSGQWKQFIIVHVLLGVAAFLGLMASSTTLLTTQEYVGQTMRGGSVLSTSNTGNTSNKSGLEWDYATAWSNGWLDLCATIIPGVAGGANGEKVKGNNALKSELRKQKIPVQANMRVPTYWGALPFTGGPFYFGIVVVLFFLLGLFLLDHPIKWWLGTATLLLCLMSLGKHFEIFNRILFDYLPYYNKFRAPSSILTVAGVLCSIFSIFTISKLYTGDFVKEKLRKSLLYSTGILSAFCSFFWILGPGFFDMSGGLETQETAILVGLRKAMMSADAMRGLIFVLIAAAILYFYDRSKIKPIVFLMSIGILSLFDILSINQRYLSHSDFVKASAKSSVHNPRPVDQQIMQDQTKGYRVMDLTNDPYNNAMPSYFHHMVGGYHPAKLRRYQDLIDRCLDEESKMLQSVLQNFNGDPNDSNFVKGMNQLQVYNMLNTKYFILGERGKEIVLPNSAANGSAWFASNIHWVNTADEEIGALRNQNLKSTAVIHKEWESMAGQAGDGQGEISLQSYEPNKLEYNSNSGSDQLAVLSEIWYGPNLGWTASIDGKPAELFRVNYALRGISVPAGNHKIILEFKPTSYTIGELLSFIGSGIMLLVLGLTLWYKKRKPSA